MMVLHNSFDHARTDEEMLFPKDGAAHAGGALREVYSPSMRFCSSTLRSEVGNLPSSPLNFQESLCRSVDRSCSVETTKNARPRDLLNPRRASLAVRILLEAFCLTAR
jgi:hypothetical protein